MGIIESLSELALRQLMGDGAQVVLRLVRDRFTDQGQRVLEALHNASKRAWQTLEVALAGTSWWDQVKGALAPREQQAFARELQSFLDATPIAELAGKIQFRKQCLSELQQARKQGIIPGGRLSAEEVARQAAGWGRHADAQVLRAAETTALTGIAQELKKHRCPNLAWLIQQRPHGGPPLLVLAVRYFFRREVEEDAELAHGLTFQQIDGLSKAQAEGFHNLKAALAKHGQRVEELLSGVRVVVQETNERVKRLEEQIQKLLDQLQMRGRELSPHDSMCIRTEKERQLVKALLEKLRQLPERELQASTGLLNDMGKVQVAVGEYKGAREAFGRAAKSASNDAARAEAHYNAYRAALEQRDWGDALQELIRAIRIDGKRFAPFPVGRYTPQRIIGAGGFGVAFLCQHMHLQVPLVVKALLLDDLDRDADNVFTEAQLLTQLDDPVFVRASDCGYADPKKKSRPYLVMDYFNGVPLDEFVRQHGPLSLADLKQIARPVAQGLQAAHAKGILHRDVKPANLLVRQQPPGWRVKLIDFGLALKRSILEDTVRSPGAWENTLAARSIAGTLDYAAPEQMGRLPGVAIGPHSDVYGFGKTCYYALLGTPDPDEKQRATLPLAWRKFLSDCTAQPGNRLADFGVVLRRLARLKTPAMSGTKRQGRLRDGKRPQRKNSLDGSGKAQEPSPLLPGIRHTPCPHCGRQLAVQEAHVGRTFRCSACSGIFKVPAREVPRLVVLRGLKPRVEYLLREGPNLVGRPGAGWVDVDLSEQEANVNVRSSPWQVRITIEGSRLTIEDLKNASGTFVNRARLSPEQKQPLQENDLIQVGSVQLQLKVGNG
jgi:serine/threonine protein kinase